MLVVTGTSGVSSRRGAVSLSRKEMCCAVTKRRQSSVRAGTWFSPRNLGEEICEKSVNRWAQKPFHQ